MHHRRRGRDRQGPESQHGQVMILFAISLLVLVMIVGVAIDGGFGLLQYRQAQNAADFAAEAAAEALYPQCTDTGTMPTGSDIVADINAVVAPNSPSTDVTSPNYGWSGYYLNAQNQPLTVAGNKVPIYYPASGAPTTPPIGACGVHLKVAPQWPPFVAQIMGVTSLRTAAGASALNPGTGNGPTTSIASLGEHGAHTILMAGKGVFEVQGTIYDNSDGCLNGGCARWNPGDIIDGKQGGVMYDWGQLEYSAAAVGNPWDGCFSGSSESAAAGKNSGSVPSSWPVTNPSSTPPSYDVHCQPPNNISPVNVSTDIWVNGWVSSGQGQITNQLPASPQDPTPASAGCGDPLLDGTTSTSGGVTTYYPGFYPNPVVITGNAVFDNCSQELGTNAVPPQPGIFYFAQGVAIEPASGDKVTGTGVLLAAAAPIPNSTLPHNVGDGEPYIGTGSGNCSILSGNQGAYSAGDEVCTGPAGPGYSCSSSHNASSWAGTNCNASDNAACGAYCFHPNPVSAGQVSCSQYPVSCKGQGLNDSIYIGGQGTVNLSKPLDGPYNQFLLWQISTTMANIGLDNRLGDSSQITLDGVIVDDSNPQGQNLSNEQYWGGEGGIPFIPGGMLLAGYGIAADPNYPGDGQSYGAWGTGFTCGPGQPGYNTNPADAGCQVTINGLALVDMFQTEGYTQLAIDGTGAPLPGLGSGAILTG